MKRLLAISLALVCSTNALAQADLAISAKDPNLWELQYSQTQPMRLPVGRNGNLTVVVGDDEIVQSVSTNPSDAWEVTIGSARNTFLVHAKAGANEAPLSVLTTKRSYHFTLVAVAPTRAPYTVRMSYAAAAPGGAENPAPTHAEYRIHGNRELRPSAMTDDGSKTYIEWRPDQAIPAVFALDGLKREEMVNGYMRDDVFTIDRVYDRLVFRIDKASTTAIRTIKKGAR